jgi:hypothetical protein
VSECVLYRVNFEQFIGRDAEGSIHDVTDILHRRYPEGARKKLLQT